MQFLQDAATGIISIDQNEVIKVLTIASVVGIPPVLVAGIYGMNFKNMPEYRLGLGLSVCVGLDRRFRAGAADLVQMEGLDLIGPQSVIFVRQVRVKQTTYRAG